MNDSQKRESEPPPDHIDHESDSRPGDYYYDDSTGYEIYEEDDDEGDDKDE